jgi:pteridine reductase
VERPLEGRVALVTGGGIRLGRAIAEGLGQAGAHVAVHHHTSAEGAAAAVARIGIDGNRAKAYRADLSRTDQAEGLIDQVERELGPISILVNSAAVFHRVSLAETTDEVLDAQWEVNARGPYIITRALVRRLAGRSADVVNIVDIGGGLIPRAHYSAYCMTKAAVAMLTRCLALELAPSVRVNAVAPGAVLPPASYDAPALGSLVATIPQRRLGTPDDVVRTVLFLLAGPQYVTGQIIAVDGGQSL